MDSFSISELAQYSGIKPHTIRIWEKRYRALTPNRSAGNTRFYDSAQLKRLLNISGLLDADYKISELCAMPDEKLKSLNGARLNPVLNTPADFFISQLIAAAVTYDEAKFVKIFSHCLLRFGMKDTYLLVLYPMFTRIGLMWLNDSLPTANEHFISHLIRQKLYTAIDSLPPANENSPVWILFLPENEFHEIGLLMSYYLIRLSGQKVIYLGTNVPLGSLRMAVREIEPDNLLLFLVRNDLPENTKKYMESLSRDLKVKQIYVAARAEMAEEIKPGKKLRLLGSMRELDELLTGKIV